MPDQPGIPEDDSHGNAWSPDGQQLRPDHSFEGRGNSGWTEKRGKPGNVLPGNIGTDGGLIDMAKEIFGKWILIYLAVLVCTQILVILESVAGNYMVNRIENSMKKELLENVLTLCYW